MKTTYENSNQDGEQKVEWWEQADFRSRVTTIYTEGKPPESFPIEDDFIICDFCNATISDFPVPVTFGQYALCKECYKRNFIQGEKE